MRISDWSSDVCSSDLRTIHGNEAADQLSSRATGERDAHLTYKEVFGNSATANRQAVDEGLEAANGTQVAGKLASERPRAAAWTILTDEGRGRLERFGEALKQELGKIERKSTRLKSNH